MTEQGVTQLVVQRDDVLLKVIQELVQPGHDHLLDARLLANDAQRGQGLTRMTDVARRYQ